MFSVIVAVLALSALTFGISRLVHKGLIRSRIRRRLQEYVK